MKKKKACRVEYSVNYHYMIMLLWDVKTTKEAADYVKKKYKPKKVEIISVKFLFPHELEIDKLLEMNSD